MNFKEAYQKKLAKTELKNIIRGKRKMKNELIFAVMDGFYGKSMRMGVLGKETPIKDKNGTQLKIGDIVIVKVSKNGLFDKTFSVVLPIVENNDVAFPMGFELFFVKKEEGEFNITLEKIKGYEEFGLNEKLYMVSFSDSEEKAAFIYGVGEE